MDFENSVLSFYVNLLSFYNKTMRDREIKDLNFVCKNYLEIIASRKDIKSSELAKLMGVSKSAVTSMVKNLIEEGYLNKIRSGEDKRIYHLSVTDKYLVTREPGEGQFKALLDKIRTRFNDKELSDIAYYLKEIENIL